jgi:hypothetical protein
VVALTEALDEIADQLDGGDASGAGLTDARRVL